MTVSVVRRYLLGGEIFRLTWHCWKIATCRQRAVLAPAPTPKCEPSFRDPESAQTLRNKTQPRELINHQCQVLKASASGYHSYRFPAQGDGWGALASPTRGKKNKPSHILPLRLAVDSGPAASSGPDGFPITVLLGGTKETPGPRLLWGAWESSREETWEARPGEGYSYTYTYTYGYTYTYTDTYPYSRSHISISQAVSLS
ncbi:hypothetical protein CB1_000243041 [Camelus ferus]|nr:hypothetical protein CB1_000243041 [Camelus ferus]